MSTIEIKCIVCNQIIAKMENALKHETPLWKLWWLGLLACIQAFGKEVAIIVLSLSETWNILIRIKDGGALVSCIISLEREWASFQSWHLYHWFSAGMLMEGWDVLSSCKLHLYSYSFYINLWFNRKRMKSDFVTAISKFF